MRDRECDDPRPQFGGDACQGKTNDTKKCIIQRCPGKWIRIFYVMLANPNDDSEGLSISPWLLNRA